MQTPNVVCAIILAYFSIHNMAQIESLFKLQGIHRNVVDDDALIRNLSYVNASTSDIGFTNLDIDWNISRSCDLFGPFCQTGSITLMSSTSIKDEWTSVAQTYTCSSFLSAQAIAIHDNINKAPQTWTESFGRSPSCRSLASLAEQATRPALTACSNTSGTVALDNSPQFPNPFLPDQFGAFNVTCCGVCHLESPTWDVVFDSSLYPDCPGMNASNISVTSSGNYSLSSSRSVDDIFTTYYSQALTRPFIYFDFAGPAVVYDDCGPIETLSKGSNLVSFLPQQLWSLTVDDVLATRADIHKGRGPWPTTSDSQGWYQKKLDVRDLHCVPHWFHGNASSSLSAAAITANLKASLLLPTEMLADASEAATDCSGTLNFFQQGNGNPRFAAGILVTQTALVDGKPSIVNGFHFFNTDDYANSRAVPKPNDNTAQMSSQPVTSVTEYVGPNAATGSPSLAIPLPTASSIDARHSGPQDHEHEPVQATSSTNIVDSLPQETTLPDSPPNTELVQPEKSPAATEDPDQRDPTPAQSSGTKTLPASQSFRERLTPVDSFRSKYFGVGQVDPVMTNVPQQSATHEAKFKSRFFQGAGNGVQESAALVAPDSGSPPKTLIGGSKPIDAPAAPPNDIVVGGQTLRVNPSGFRVSDQQVKPGAAPVTIGDVPVALQTDGILHVGSSTIRLRPERVKDRRPNNAERTANPSSLVIGGQTLQLNPTGFYVAGGQIRPGDPTMTVDGTPIALEAGGVLHVGTSIIRLPPTNMIDHDSVVTVAGLQITANPTGFNVAGMQVKPTGSAVTLDGQKISLDANGALVVGSSTINLEANPTVNALTTEIAGQAVVVDASAITVNGTSVIAGGASLTISGTSVHLNTAGLLTIGTLTTDLSSHPTLSSGALVFESETVKPMANGFIVDGKTIAPAGVDKTVDGIPIRLETNGILHVGSQSLSLPRTNSTVPRVTTMTASRTTATAVVSSPARAGRQKLDCWLLRLSGVVSCMLFMLI